MRFVTIASMLLLSCSGAAWAQEADLALDQIIALPDVAGRIDHLAIDLGGRRLFVAEHGNDAVDVVDLTTGKPTGRITGLSEPQGILFLEEQNEVAVANGGTGTVQFFSGDTLAPVASIDAGRDADNLRYDPSSRRMLVGYDGGLGVIDPAAHSLAATVTLPAHVEGFQIDPEQQRVFINLPGAHAIAAADLGSQQLREQWDTEQFAGNFPVAILQKGMVAAAFRSPGALAILATTTGEFVASHETCGDADDLFFNADRAVIYVICGAGEVRVVRWYGSALEERSTLRTRRGARTGLFVPELGKLYVAAPAAGSEPAAILVFTAH